VAAVIVIVFVVEGRAGTEESSATALVRFRSEIA
jgi:hypothetical protein